MVSRLIMTLCHSLCIVGSMVSLHATCNYWCGGKLSRYVYYIWPTTNILDWKYYAS